MFSSLFVPKSSTQFLLRPVEELKFEKNNRVNFWTTSTIDAKLWALGWMQDKQWL